MSNNAINIFINSYLELSSLFNELTLLNNNVGLLNQELAKYEASYKRYNELNSIIGLKSKTFMQIIDKGFREFLRSQKVDLLKIELEKEIKNRLLIQQQKLIEQKTNNQENIIKLEKDIKMYEMAIKNENFSPRKKQLEEKLNSKIQILALYNQVEVQKSKKELDLIKEISSMTLIDSFIPFWNNDLDLNISLEKLEKEIYKLNNEQKSLEKDYNMYNLLLRQKTDLRVKSDYMSKKKLFLSKEKEIIENYDRYFHDIMSLGLYPYHNEFLYELLKNSDIFTFYELIKGKTIFEINFDDMFYFFDIFH